jgi:hypothetical protein
MKLGTESVIRFFQPLALILLLILLPPIASAQHEKAPAPAPKSAPAPHPAPVQHPAPAQRLAGGGGNTGIPGGAPAGRPEGAPGATSRTATGGAPGGNRTNTTGATNNRTTGSAGGTNRTNTNTDNRTNTTGTANSRTTPNSTTVRTVTPNPTTVRTVSPNAAGGQPGANSKVTGNTSATGGKNVGTVRTNTLTAATGGKPGATGTASKGASPNATHANNQPGTHALPNGGTRTVRSNGSTVERNNGGKVTGVTTSKGATAKMDAHGHPAAIHDGHGTTIHRGPHGERRVETVRGDHSRLVSTGRHSGFAEQRFSRGEQEYARRSYYDHGHYYARVYLPYYYGGYSYYGYIPPYYYGSAYYGWVYNPWPAPVVFSWGWYGSPWYAPYGYYFYPYQVYPAPAFWLTDYAIAASLQAGAEEAESGSLHSEPGFAPASAHPDEQKKDAGTVVMTKELKDRIAKQVKMIIADEKASAATQRNLPPDEDRTEQVPPSRDPRFTLFIDFSSLSLDADEGACALTAGDIVRRSEDIPDADNTVAVEVVSSKSGDCAVGTASRMKVDDLEEMHDSFRQKVDDGLKSLSENQGKGGIPSGPAATPQTVPEGQAAPDLAVESDLKKQQEAADATEKDVQDATSNSGSAD